MARTLSTLRIRIASILATLGILAATLAVTTSVAGAAQNRCRVRNATQDTAVRSNLQQVINAANPSDRIVVQGVCVGNFRIEQRLTVVGDGTDRLRQPVLKGDGSGTVLRVFARATIVNLRITGGDALVGGGIVNEGELTLRRSLVRGNTATEAGGGIGNGGILRLNRSVVRANSAPGGVGSGIYNDDTITLIRSVVRGNVGADSGGGIYNESTATVTLNDSSSVRENSATDAGGGIYNLGTLTLNRSIVRGNSAAGSGGGGIYNDVDGILELNSTSSVRGNEAVDASGGGVFTNGVVVLNGSSSVRGNEADRYGGGIQSLDGDVLMNDDSSVTGNRADVDDDAIGTGGGIWDCGTLNGAVADANVNDNYLGSSGTTENNIVVCP